MSNNGGRHDDRFVGRNFEGEHPENFYFSSNFRLGNDGALVSAASDHNVPLRHSLVQWLRHPLNKYYRWFRVQVLTKLTAGQDIMIGINTYQDTASKTTPCWNMFKSLRYRSSDGGVYTEGTGLPSDFTYGSGDTIVCYIEQICAHRTLISFFKNSVLVYRQWLNVPPTHLYPAIGVSNGPVLLEVMWPGSDIPDSKIPINRTSLKSWIGYTLIERDDKTKRFHVVRHDDKDGLGYALQAPTPLDLKKNYFEMRVCTGSNQETGPSIGLTPAWSDKYKLPGFSENTIGYHGDDGGIYHEREDGPVYKSESLKYTEGDRVGCGFVPTKKMSDRDVIESSRPVVVYFTLNDTVMYSRVVLELQGGFYPTVGLYTPGQQVEVKVDSKAPKLPKSLLQGLRPMFQLFDEFRLCQAFTFVDCNRNNIEFLPSSSRPALLQYLKEMPTPEPYIELQVVEIGNDTTFQIGMAPVTTPLQGEMVQQGSHEALVVSAGTVRLGDTLPPCPLSLGDKIGCFMEHCNPYQTMLCYTINGRILGRILITNIPDDVMCPTVTVSNGSIRFSVLWPDETDQIKQNRYLKDCSNWTFPEGVQLQGQTLCRQPGGGKDIVMTALGSLPLPKHAQSYFQYTIVTVEFHLPGIGVSSGVLAPIVKDSQLLKDIVILLPSTKQLLTPGGLTERGVKTSVLAGPLIPGDRCGVLVSPQGDVGCSLQYVVNGKVAATYTTVVPPGGLYPVIYFPSKSRGAVVQVEVCDDKDSVKKHVPVDSFNQLQTQTTILDYGGDISWIPEGRMGREDKLSSVTNIYVSHSPADLPIVRQITDRLKAKAYNVQTTLWSEDSLDKFMDLVLAEVVVFCISPNTYTQVEQLEEIICVQKQAVPLLPVLIGPSPWPPGGRFSQLKSFLDSYDHIKIDLVDQTIGDMEIGWIELHVVKSIDTAKRLEEGSNLEANQDVSEDEYDDVSLDDFYVEQQHSNSRSCILL